MMKIRPLEGRVVVRRLPAEEKHGSIYIPDMAREKPSRAEIVAVGPGRVLENGTLVEPRVKKGDVVLFTKYTGTETKIDGEEIVVLREEDIIGVFES